MTKINDPGSECCGCGGCFSETEDRLGDTDAYAAGHAAAISGSLLITDNPNALDTDDWLAWRAGWLRAGISYKP